MPPRMIMYSFVASSTTTTRLVGKSTKLCRLVSESPSSWLRAVSVSESRTSFPAEGGLGALEPQRESRPQAQTSRTAATMRSMRGAM